MGIDNSHHEVHRRLTASVKSALVGYSAWVYERTSRGLDLRLAFSEALLSILIVHKYQYRTMITITIALSQREYFISANIHGDSVRVSLRPLFSLISHLIVSVSFQPEISAGPPPADPPTPRPPHRYLRRTVGVSYRTIRLSKHVVRKVRRN